MKFRGHDYAVDVSNNLPRKLISQYLNAKAFSLLSNLESIIRNGEYVGSGDAVTKNGSPKKNIVRYDYFESDVTIGGQPYLVKWEVEIVPGANNYKTHRLVDMTIDPVEGTARTGSVDQELPTTGPMQGEAEAPNPTSPIPQSAPAVNIPHSAGTAQRRAGDGGDKEITDRGCDYQGSPAICDYLPFYDCRKKVLAFFIGTWYYLMACV